MFHKIEIHTDKKNIERFFFIIIIIDVYNKQNDEMIQAVIIKDLIIVDVLISNEIYPSYTFIIIN